ncbi:MAG: NTP transferase domain-containing protein [Myxococcota bacterium]
MTRLAAVVLAAGASTRMGRPKALLRWRGRPFVLHAIELARVAGAKTIVVVEGAVPLPDDALGGSTRARNEAWAEGPLGSLQCGLRAATAAQPGASVMVLTVDRPHIDPGTVTALAAACEADPQAVWQPRHGERRGHPIVYPADLALEICALQPPQTPRDLLSRPAVAARRRQIEVNDSTVLDNLDRPEDLDRLPP